MEFFFFLLSLFLSSFFCFIFKNAKEKFCDFPSDDKLKIHKKPISFLGGLAMLLAILTPLFLNVFFEKKINFQIFGIILASLLIFSVGFLDDYKWKKTGVNPFKKFLFLISFSIFSGIILIFSGTKIEFFPKIFPILFLTSFYIFTLINAVNFEDGIDGLAGGMVGISLIGFTVLSLILKNDLPFFLSLTSLMGVLGFLIFNFPPAKIFMGDSGAYFLGFILAVLAALFSKPFNFKSFISPVFIIGLPIFEIGMIVIRRFFKKKPLLYGDRGHFYDKMIQRGISVRKTILFFYLLQLISVIFGILIYLYV